jgi:hypothetical protein
MTLNITDAGLKVAAISMGALNAISLFLLAMIFSDIDALEAKDSYQAQYNVETYARRDDVRGMEKRIIQKVEVGFADLKLEFRASKNQ